MVVVRKIATSPLYVIPEGALSLHRVRFRPRLVRVCSLWYTCVWITQLAGKPGIERLVAVAEGHGVFAS